MKYHVFAAQTPQQVPYVDNLNSLGLTQHTFAFSEYNQQDGNVSQICLFFVRRSKCFRRVFRPSSGAQNCTYRPLLLPAASLARLAAGSSNGMTNT